MLKDKKILLGVTGGIAAYKSCALASMLSKLGCKIDVIMTENALKFIGKATFQALTHRQVYTDTFSESDPSIIQHIDLPAKADAFVIAPATANTIAKIANGIGDNLLTSAALARRGTGIIVPAMNTFMYENPATQENIEKLKKNGWYVMTPSEGRLACGETGKGKMPEPQDIVETIEHLIGYKKDMIGEKVIVTAGPTRESLDPVRYLTNHSTGRMGYEIAKAASNRGAEVVLISGPTSIKPPLFTKIINITSAEGMYQAVIAEFPKSTIVIKAAAVADYRPISIAENKIKKKDGNLNLPLERTKDILKTLGELRSKQIICGFSMETENLIENSRQKLERKKVQMIAANSLNTPGAGFGTPTNVITLITKDSSEELPLMGKDEVAHIILDRIMELKQK